MFFNLRSATTYLALVAASSPSYVSTVAALGAQAQIINDNVAPLLSEGIEPSISTAATTSTSTSITPFDEYISSMFLKRASIPANAAINILPKRDVGFSAMASLLKRNIYDMVKREECGEEVEDDGRTSSKLIKRQSLGAIDPDGWEKNATDGCMTALGQMNTDDNPSGMMACYNIAFLDALNGTFLSELRLYKVNEPSGEWVSVGDQMSVNVQYENAMVQLQDTLDTPPALRRRQNNANVTVGDSNPMKVFNFAGMINEDSLPGKDGNKNDREAIVEATKQVLMPNITLQGLTADGNQLNVSLVESEVAYVAGVFAAEVNENGTITVLPEEFVLPGTMIEIVPEGLYLYSAYMFLFVVILGYGTVERWKHRDMYRRRLRRDDKVAKI